MRDEAEEAVEDEEVESSFFVTRFGLVRLGLMPFSETREDISTSSSGSVLTEEEGVENEEPVDEAVREEVSFESGISSSSSCSSLGI
jgi:hypothetical protein